MGHAASAEVETPLPSSAEADRAYDRAAAVVSGRESGGPLWTIAAINAWNRAAVPSRTEPAA